MMQARAGQRRIMMPVPRERTVPPPPIGWQWQPSIVMKDKAAAANKAVTELFKPELIAMCFAHVYMWFDRNKGLFRDWQANGQKIKESMVQLNNQISDPELSNTAMVEMLKQWEVEYDEPKVAKAFRNVWGAETFTRAGTNATCFGGVPSDNNALEGKNGALKRDLHHKRFGTAPFVKVICKWLEDESVLDCRFGEEYNPLAWNFNTFKRVFDLVETECGPFQCKMRAHNLVILPTWRTMEEAVTVFDCERTPTALKAFFRSPGADGSDAWLTTYLRLHSKPESYNMQRSGKDPEWNFDAVIMWCSAFETLTDLPDGVFKQEQVRRLEQGKCAVDTVRINRPDGLCACKCTTYMHYVVCEHVIADAMIKGSVTGYPPNFDVRRIGQRVGRPPKAAPGGALGMK